MKIAVDAFGGDHAPVEIIKGCAAAAEEFGTDIILTGDKDVIEQVMAKRLSVVHAPSVITMEDDPLAVIKAKKDSSMAVALRLLKDGQADAFVSAGNSGAVLVGATMIVKRIKGIKRAALAPVLPTREFPF